MDNYIIRKIDKKRGDKYKYKYYDKRDNEINNIQIINDAKKDLYIPPAYDNVKINLCKSENVYAGIEKAKGDIVVNTNPSAMFILSKLDP